MNALRLPRRARILIVAASAALAGMALLAGAGADPASAANSTIGVSTAPTTVAVSADGATLYVVNQAADSVSVIDAASRTLVSTVFVGSQPFSIAVRPGGSEVYVSNLNSDTVSVIDTATNLVTDTIPVASLPYGIAFSKDGATAFVVSEGANVVTVIDTTTHALDPLTPFIPVGSAPFGIAVSPDGSALFVSNQGDNSVTRIDVATKTVVAPAIPVTANPFFLAIDPAGTRVYVGGLAGNEVTVIETATNQVVATIALPSGVRGLALSPSGRYLFAVADGQPLQVIDTTTYLFVSSPVPLPVGSNPVGLALSPTGETAYVVNQNDDDVSVLDLPTPPAITSASPPAASVGTPYSFTVTASGFPAPTLSLAGALPAGLAFDANTGEISGTPTAPGPSSFTIAAASGFGDPAAATFTITVAAALAATGAAPGVAVWSGVVLLLVGSALALIGRRAQLAGAWRRRRSSSAS